MRNLIAMYIAMQSRMQSLVKNEKGATMVEYALMVALIAVVCIGAVTVIGERADATFDTISAKLPAVTTTTPSRSKLCMLEER